MALQQDIGKLGEDLAVQCLEAHGHTILQRNWRHRHEEIDIISKDGDEIVFTEVKCRSGQPADAPYRAVGTDKRRLLVRAANAFIRQFHIKEEVRFDVVSIELGPPRRIEYIPRAFYPPVSGSRK
jgi:putative endonuclease